MNLLLGYVLWLIDTLSISPFREIRICTNSFHERKYFFSWRKVFMFMMRNISFHKKKPTVWLRLGRNICIRDNKKRGNSAKNCPFSWFYFLQSTLVLLWNWIDRNVLFYLFSASIALIFCFTSSISSLSFWMRRFISSIRLLPFFELMLRKPRLFS